MDSAGFTTQNSRKVNHCDGYATFHKRKDIIQAIEDKGHIIEWLPPYSPDLNDIEHKWSQAKSHKRKQQCSIIELFNHNHL